MRIHTDLTYSDLCRALPVSVSFTRCDQYGSRKRDRAFDLILTGTSGRRQNGGTDEAASWDEWGEFLAALYRMDARLITPYYHGPEHYRWATGARFTDTFYRSHRSHRWQWSGDCVTGSYSVHECTCGALRRQLTGSTWDALSACA